MLRRPGVVLAVSFAIMIVLVLVMLITHQENQGWGPLRLAVLVFAGLSIGYAILFGLRPTDGDKSTQRGKRVHRGSDPSA